MNHRSSILLAAVIAISASTSFAADKTPGKLIKDMSWGPIEAKLTAEQDVVRYDRDVLVTLRLSAPKGVDIDPISLEGRLNGFTLSGEYGGEPTVAGDRIIIEKHARLTPSIADEHRIAPIPISFTDNRKTPAASRWFPTLPVVFESIRPSDTAATDITDSIEPLWIRPSLTEAVWLLLGLLGVAFIIWLVIKLIKGLRRAAILRQMSPKERALNELEILLDRKLPENGLFKDFYIELTMIVRRYIERAHHIKAPEQTTEEFLEAVSQDSRFSENVMTTLKSFLEAADLVKFAAYLPNQSSVNNSINTARDYINTDSSEARKDD
ncbi:hypothetical protein BVX97_05310 [bacterium E08(2017)]|nr:hypothetical protein BVX97_05310 [bacterium E08(2017)]